MATHPYISGAGNITQMVKYLRKNFPATVNSDTVRKLGLASKNESYVINVLQFLHLIEEDGSRTEKGHEVMTIHQEPEFQKAFAELIREAYADLFELHGEDVWSLKRDQLIGYFRGADKTSEVIGTRQAGVLMALRELAGYENEQPVGISKSRNSAAERDRGGKKRVRAAEEKPKIAAKEPTLKSNSDMALTVRIEINLPAEGTKETYDAIFRSIKANLFP